MGPHFNSVFDLQINYSEACLISGKVTSLPKVIKYVKRSKYSFHDFSAKHTPSATLNVTVLVWGVSDRLTKLIFALLSLNLKVIDNFFICFSISFYGTFIWFVHMPEWNYIIIVELIYTLFLFLPSLQMAWQKHVLVFLVWYLLLKSLELEVL